MEWMEEAMACGTPAVVYNCTALPEVVSEDSGRIVEANNIKQVWKVIQEMSGNSYDVSMVVTPPYAQQFMAMKKGLNRKIIYT